MERYFGLDSKFAAIMTRLADLVILNAVFLISCLPVITIGSALKALYTVTLKMCRNEESYIVKSYLKAMKQEFLKSAILGIAAAGTGVMLWFDITVLKGGGSDILKTALAAAVILWNIIVPYIFPVCAQFHKTAGRTLYISVLLALRHTGYSLLIACANGGLLFCFLAGGRALGYLLVWFLVIGFSAGALGYSYVYNHIFDKYK